MKIEITVPEKFKDESDAITILCGDDIHITINPNEEANRKPVYSSVVLGLRETLAEFNNMVDALQEHESEIIVNFRKALENKIIYYNQRT